MYAYTHWGFCVPSFAPISVRLLLSRALEIGAFVISGHMPWAVRASARVSGRTRRRLRIGRFDVRRRFREVMVMARCKITHQWDDGSATVVEAHVAETFADCLDECRVAVVKMWREVVEDAEVEAPVQPESDG